MEFLLSLPRADPHLRQAMIEKQLKQRGIDAEALLQSMLEIPRELFVPSRFFHGAYEDVAIPIGYQRYSYPPYVVALMAEAAQVSPSDRVLDIGTGCGYPAAVLSRLCHSVFTVEPVEELYEDASDRLRELGFANVAVLFASPAFGCPQRAPFDAILVREPSFLYTDEGAEEQEALQTLMAQLAVNGRMVLPVRRERDSEGDREAVEAIVRLTKLAENSFLEETILQYPFSSFAFEADDF